MATDVKGVIFDLDGTLYRMHWIMRPFITLRVFPNILRLPRFIKERNRFAGIDMNSRDKLMDQICDALSKTEKCSSKVMRQWIDETFYPAFIDSMLLFKNSRPDINQTLEQLKKNQLKLAVLSDYDKVKERLLKLAIEPSFFDVITSSESFGALKPSGRPFMEIAGQWDIDPCHILVVGDRTDTDGAGAKAAGMNFRQITDNKKDPTTTWLAVRDYLLSIG